MNTLIVGGSRADRERAASAEEHTIAAPAAIVSLDSTTLPFVRPSRVLLPAAGPRLFRVRDVHDAFPNPQSTGTRLILTQSTYLLQKWLDAIEPGDVIVATADRDILQRVAPEALQRRGPWRSFTIMDLDSKGIRLQPDSMTTDSSVRRIRLQADSSAAGVATDSPLAAKLAHAYRSPSPEERLAICREAVADEPDSAVARLALASAWREQQDLEHARAALDEALRLAPDWEAAHYEIGKFWLGCENLIAARDAFERAASLMPSFSAALINLGATLGELGEPQAALGAFERAAEVDPENFTVLNNIGVVNRELGRLAESETACRRVIALAPDFVFGYYNLGHTLFLAGRFSDALAAYDAGQRRDPEKNRRQACRLAIVRFANGDVAGAERDLWQYANLAPPDEREDLLLEAFEISQAVIEARPELAVHRAFLEKIASAIRPS